jgi:surface antigen
MTQENTGQVIGAVVGGAAASRVGQGSGKTAAIIAGTLVGAYLGGYIGRQMDENDRYRTYQTLEGNPTGQTSSWTNPDTGYQYEVTPTRTYSTGAGPCREYVTEAWIDGRREEVRGTACRQPDGSWRAAN